MRSKLLTCGVAAAALGAAAAGGAHAAPTLSLEGAYLYVDQGAGGKPVVRVVFRTAAPLPLRSDGGVGAAALIDDVGHQVRAAKRGTTCYTAAAEVNGGSIATIHNNAVLNKGVKTGRTFTLKVLTAEAQSQPMGLKLRARRPGDRSGRRLGC